MAILSDELFAEAVCAAVDVCEMEADYDYGYGGDLYQRDIVSNWPEIVAAVLAVVEKASVGSHV